MIVSNRYRYGEARPQPFALLPNNGRNSFTYTEKCERGRAHTLTQTRSSKKRSDRISERTRIMWMAQHQQQVNITCIHVIRQGIRYQRTTQPIRCESTAARSRAHDHTFTSLFLLPSSVIILLAHRLLAHESLCILEYNVNCLMRYCVCVCACPY